MYTLSFFKKTWAVIATALVVTLCVSMFLLKNAQAQTSSGNVTGDMWSSTMGRISLNCKTGGATGQNICATSSYGLNVVPNTSTQTGAISGYAWGTYIGWVSFNPSDVTSCGTGAPATINFTTGAFSGWARALVGTTASGWDGCISLSGSGYGVTYNSSSATNNITGDRKSTRLNSSH